MAGHGSLFQSYADDDLMDMDVDHYQATKRNNYGHGPSGAGKARPSDTIFYGAAAPVPSTSSSSSAPSVSHNVPNSLTTRQVLRARRKLADQHLPLKKYICVLDTNVILDDLNGIKSLIVNNGMTRTVSNASSSHQHACDNATNSRSSTTEALHSQPYAIHQIIVPMVVFQELDGIKMSRQKGLSQTAQNAIKFLNEQLKMRNSLLKGEPDKNPANRMSECTLPVENDDDRILDCCIRLKELFPDKTVILLSNDINLQSKAIVWEVDAISFDTFKKAQRAQFTDSVVKAKFKQPAQEEANESILVTKRHKSNAIPSKSFSSMAVVHELTQSLREALNSKPLGTTVPFTASKALTASSKPHIADIQLKYQLEMKLISFIVNASQKIFGDNWTNVFNRFNPKNATLNDSLRLLNSNWHGVFSDCFKRNRVVKDTLMALLDRKNASNQELLNNLYKQLLSFVSAAK